MIKKTDELSVQEINKNINDGPTYKIKLCDKWYVYYMDDECDIRYISFPEPQNIIINEKPYNYILNMKNYSVIINNMFCYDNNESIELRLMTDIRNKELFNLIYKNINNFFNQYNYDSKIIQTIQFNNKIDGRKFSYLKCIIINMSYENWNIFQKYLICTNCCQLVNKSLRKDHICDNIIIKKYKLI